MGAAATGLAPYPSPEAREAELDALATELGAELVTYGESVEGRPLRAARIPSSSDDAGPPRVLCSANIHGIEFIAGRVALGLLRRLCVADPDPGSPIARLRARAEVWVVPSINPDGYARTWAAEGAARRLADLRANANGVDLNRNYPLPRGARPSNFLGAGSDRPGDATFRGTHPLSEPETAALDGLMQRVGFHASANLHSFMGTVIPARVTRRPVFRAYKGLCRALGRGQARHRYRRLSSRLFDVFTGEQEDHQHHAHDTWAACVESFPVLHSFRQHWRAPSLFWRFNPRQPDRWVDNDVPGLVAFFHAALDLPRPATLAGDRPALTRET